MDCRHIKPDIQSFFDQQLDPKKTLQVEEHLEQCSSCAKDYASYKSLTLLLESAEYPRCSPDEWKMIYGNINTAISSIRRKKNNDIIVPFFNSRHLPIKALAALIVISLISVSTFVFFPGTITYPKIVAIDGNAFSNSTSEVPDARKPAHNNNSLPPGHSIETDYNSSVKIQVDEGSTIQLGRNSNFSVANFAAKKTVLSLKTGDLLAQVSKRTPDQLFRIETPNAYCEVIGTRFNIATLHDNFRNRYITTLIVYEGTVQFGSGAHHLPVKAGSAVAMFGDSIGITTSIEDPLIKLLQQRPGYGRYTITSNPHEAQVSIDGIPCGVTPFTGFLPYGNHSVNCSKNGFTLWSGTLEIDAQRLSTLAIGLKQGTLETQHSPILLVGNDTLKNQPLGTAIARINAGDYHNALIQLTAIINNQSSTPSQLAAALSRASMCYKYIGKYSDAVQMLNRIIDSKLPADHRETALFERATIYQTMLHDINRAIVDFDRYVNEFKGGIWAEEAMSTLADLQYSKSNFVKAAASYQTYCDNFDKNIRREKALFRMAMIYSGNLNDPKRAFNAYTRLLLEFPNSSYTEDAQFWSADCLLRQGKTSSALAGFSSYAKRYPNGKWRTEVMTRLKRSETAEVK